MIAPMCAYDTQDTRDVRFANVFNDTQIFFADVRYAPRNNIPKDLTVDTH